MRELLSREPPWLENKSYSGDNSVKMRFVDIGTTEPDFAANLDD